MVIFNICWLLCVSHAASAVNYYEMAAMIRTTLRLVELLWCTAQNSASGEGLWDMHRVWQGTGTAASSKLTRGLPPTQPPGGMEAKGKRLERLLIESCGLKSWDLIKRGRWWLTPGLGEGRDWVDNSWEVGGVGFVGLKLIHHQD